jgi:hypothetical protein
MTRAQAQRTPTEHALDQCSAKRLNREWFVTGQSFFPEKSEILARVLERLSDGHNYQDHEQGPHGSV